MSYAFSVSRTSAGELVTLTGYDCRLKVVTFNGKEDTTIDRAVSTLSGDSKSFLINITPTETLTLTAGTVYSVIAELSNSSIGYARQMDFELKIKDTDLD